MEAVVEILEQPLGDVPAHLQFIQGSQQECLVQHRGQYGIGSLMSRNVNNPDARHLLTSFKVGYNVHPAGFGGLADAGIQVEAFLEVDVNDVVATNNSAQWNTDTVYIDTVESRD